MPDVEREENIDVDDDISITSTVGSNQQEEYEVETILAELPVHDGTMRYLVKWCNYPYDRCTWEPVESFYTEQTLHDWEAKKRDIAEGRINGFDLLSWEKQMDALQIAQSDRKRRRREKRIRLGLEPDSQLHGAVSTEAEDDALFMPMDEEGESSSGNARVSDDAHPPPGTTTSQPLNGQSGTRPTSSPPQPIGRNLGTPAKKSSAYPEPGSISAPTLASPSKRERPSDTDLPDPAELPTPSLRRRHTGKARKIESHQDASDLNTIQLLYGMSEGGPDTAAEAESANASLDNNHLQQENTGNGFSTSPRMANGLRVDSIPEPKMEETFQKTRKMKHPNDVVALVYYGVSKEMVGEVRIRGMTRKGVHYFSQRSIPQEIWFRSFCTVEEYAALCYNVSFFFFFFLVDVAVLPILLTRRTYYREKM